MKKKYLIIVTLIIVGVLSISTGIYINSSNTKKNKSNENKIIKIDDSTDPIEPIEPVDPVDPAKPVDPVVPNNNNNKNKVVIPNTNVVPSVGVTVNDQTYDKIVNDTITKTEDLSPINGTFVTPGVAHDYTEADWVQERKEWKELGIKYLIIGEIAVKERGTDYWNTFYPSELGNNMYYNSVDIILNQAKLANIKVIMSIGTDLDYSNLRFCSASDKSRWMGMVPKTIDFFREAYNHFKDKYSNQIIGAYFPPELSNSDSFDTDEVNDCIDNVSSVLNAVISGVRSVNPDLLIMLSPYVNIKEEATWNTHNAINFSNFWKGVINNTNFRSNDILAPQDSIGATGMTLDKLATWTQAYRNAINNANKKIQLWSNAEIFKGYSGTPDENDYVEYTSPTFTKTLVSQTETVKPYVDNIIMVSGNSYISTSNNLSGFYNCYKNYLVTGKINSTPPTLPTTITGSTFNLDGTNVLRIDFSGMTDEYGIARFEVYKNDLLFTYRVATRRETWKGNIYYGKSEPTWFFDRSANVNNDLITYKVKFYDIAGNGSNFLTFTVKVNNGHYEIIK